MSALVSWPEEHLALSQQERQQAAEAVRKAFAPTLESLEVDIGFSDLCEQIYVPMAAWLVARQRAKQSPLIVGLNGAQGAGKSTLFNLLEVILSDGFGLNVVGFSIDDLYRTQEERGLLSEQVHPLLKTRGVPGTHDVALGQLILQSLCKASEHQVTKIPVFDKSIDDRCPSYAWQEWHGGADIIFLEGWCVGAGPQSAEQLVEPVNELERLHDPSGQWRQYVNKQLQGEYRQLFEMLDLLVMLKVPSMKAVFKWRSLQEQKLAERVEFLHQAQPEDLRIMDEQQLHWFIQHYERLTRSILEEMPGRANLTLELNCDHKIAAIRLNSD